MTREWSWSSNYVSLCRTTFFLVTWTTPRHRPRESSERTQRYFSNISSCFVSLKQSNWRLPSSRFQRESRLPRAYVLNFDATKLRWLRAECYNLTYIESWINFLESLIRYSLENFCLKLEVWPLHLSRPVTLSIFLMKTNEEKAIQLHAVKS